MYHSKISKEMYNEMYTDFYLPTEYNLFFYFSLTNDMGTKPIGRSSVWHGRDNRLPDGGIPQVNKLLVVQRLKDDVVP